MKKFIIACFAVLVCFSVQSFAQISIDVLVNIVKAEDERRFDKTLEDLMKAADAKIRTRAALAAGRIGDERGVSMLVNLLENDSSTEVRTMAAFALGEIESVKAADAIIKILADTKVGAETRARAIEAAGKIAAANTKDEKSKQLGAAILATLDFENEKRSRPFQSVIAFGLTAVLRARPVDAEKTLVKFIDAYTAQIRANALNALARLRAKNANEKSRELLQKDAEAVVRANAARVLGAAEDKDSFDVLLNAATTDVDSRVRVSAIRSLGSLKNAEAAGKLLERANALLAVYKKPKSANPSEKNELLEIATTLGRILPKSNSGTGFEAKPDQPQPDCFGCLPKSNLETGVEAAAVKFLDEFRAADRYQSPETEIALARLAPDYKEFNFEPYGLLAKNSAKTVNTDWRIVSSIAQGFGELAKFESNDPEKKLRKQAEDILREPLEDGTFLNTKIYQPAFTMALPDILRAFAEFKTADLNEILRDQLKHKDVFVRATAVELLGELPPEQIKFGDFEDAFRLALEDEKNDDALTATIEAVGKQKTERATDFLKDRLYFLAKLNPKYGMSRYLARRRIAALLKEKDAGDFSAQIGATDSIFTARDYIRAVSRRNARAILTTAKGTFTIEFFPEDAPITVDNFIRLAKANYFNGLTIHRVVPNFVMQDGDPRGDGNGGPGWQIRCELNMREYERGTVGMALSGKDTGGSQWFVTHSPQPHLDGGYTVFGRVNETGMKVVDNLTRGDKILSVKIIEGNLPQRTRRKRN